MPKLHRLLERQIKREFDNLDNAPADLEKFIEVINKSYREFEADRNMLEWSLELSSNELLQANSDMRAIFKALPDLFFRIDENNNIIDYKAGLETDIPLSPSEFIGKNIYTIPLINSDDLFDESIKKIKETNTKVNLEYSIQLDGKTRYYEARLLPLIKKQILIIFRDMTERKKAEKDLKDSQNRLQKQNQILVETAVNNSLLKKDSKKSLQKITESAAKGLDTERVSIWLYNENRSEINCIDLYEKNNNKHSSGLTLKANDYPIYFQAIETNRATAVNDVSTHPATTELLDAYLKPLNITSMLDISIRAGGKTIGVVCHEHIGTPREWALEEENFAGSIADMISLVLEAHERSRAQKAQRESEERFRILAETTDSPIFALHDYFVYVNPAMETLTGYSEDELLSMGLEDIIHPDFKKYAIELSEIRKSSATGPMRFEIKIITRNKKECWIFLTAGLIKFENKPTILASAFDLTERKIAEEQLRHQAFHDTLTDLPNRALFMDRLEHAMARSKRRDNYLFSVLFFDLDRFKVLNDSLGHAIGDQLLVEIGKRLKILLRDADTIARLGGDEFTVLLEDVKNTSEVTNIAERIQEELSKPFILDDKEVFTTVSIGIAMSDTGYKKPDHILRDADIAMYRAKAKGKACYEIFDSIMRTRALKLLELETALRRAIENKEFTLMYQPIVDTYSCKIKGFEALIRWKHPEYGFISPVEFIPLAEETGMIVPIGKWVMEESCRQLKEWHETFPDLPLKISINVSSKQFTHIEFIDDVKSIIHKNQIDPSCLKFEMTETMVMENSENVLNVLTQLKGLDIELSIDDFGTGYSSLSYLHKFPINTLKIDRSFVSDIGPEGENSELVKTIIVLAHNLNLDVIAEGVETEDQLKLLRDLDCEFSQGYYFSKPVPPEEAATLLAETALPFTQRKAV